MIRSMSLLVRVLLGCAAVAASLAPAALGAPHAGSSVRSFGENGFATQAFGTEPGTGGAEESAAMPDGGFLIRTDRGLVGRYLLDGSLDAAFGEDGYLFRLGAEAIATAADGRIYLLSGSGSEPRVLWRLLADGSPDPSFGVGGMVRLGDDRSFDAVVPAPSGGVFVAGGIVVEDRDQDTAHEGIEVLALNPDGSLRLDLTVPTPKVSVETDPRFAVEGEGLIFALRGSSEQPLILGRIRSDGSLDPGLEGSLAKDAKFGYVVGLDLAADGGLLLADGEGRVLKLAADGSPDPGFGKEGIATVEALKLAGPTKAFALGSEGNLYFGANTYDREEDPSHLMIASLLPDGTPNPGLGAGSGVMTIDAGGHDSAADLSVLAGGALLFTGSTNHRPPEFIAAARFLPGGAHDAGFGSGGLLLARPLRFSEDVAVGVLPRPGGRLMVVGRAQGQALVAAYRRSGRPDLRFGDRGRVSATALGAGPSSEAAAIAPLGREQALVAIDDLGFHSEEDEKPGTAIVVALRPDGGINRGFAENGALDVRGFSRVADLDRAADGSYFAAGFSKRCKLRVARYGPDGELDRRFATPPLNDEARNCSRGRVDLVLRPGGGAFVAILGSRMVFATDADGTRDGGFRKVRAADPRRLPDDIGALAVDRRGGLLVAGTVHSRLGVVRVTPHGRVGRRFGFRGSALREIGRRAEVGAMRLDAGGRILVAGKANLCAEAPCSGPAPVAVRFDRDGRLDRTFGRAGIWLGARRGAEVEAMTFDGPRSMVLGGTLSRAGDRDLMLAKVRR
jgi:uncharacterized delta-60 repeat protein